jgi:hypothetical protein
LNWMVAWPGGIVSSSPISSGIGPANPIVTPRRFSPFIRLAARKSQLLPTHNWLRTVTLPAIFQIRPSRFTVAKAGTLQYKPS